MVRAHFIDDRVRELMRHLGRDRRGFDLFLTFDETHGAPDIGLPNVMRHSLARCAEIGLTQRNARLMWWCSDFPFYFALKDIPNYRYYVLIEYDVFLTEQNASLLNDLSDILLSGRGGQVDGVLTRLRPEAPQADHPLYASAFSRFNTTYTSFFPFVVLSRPAASFLYAQRLIEAARDPEAVAHAEAFVPSHLIAGGYACVDLYALLPRSYRIELMMLSGRQFGLPRSMVDGFEGVSRMIYPVYSDEEFVRRMLGRHREERQKKYLIGRLDSGEFDQLPEQLRADLRAGLV